MLAGMVVRHLRLLGLVLVLGSVLVAGCGDDDYGSSAPSTESSEVSSDVLDGRTFESTDVSGETLVDGTTVTLTFEGDGLSANAGCNTMNATYEVADGVLTVGPLGQTLMACEDELRDARRVGGGAPRRRADDHARRRHLDDRLRFHDGHVPEHLSHVWHHGSERGLNES